MTGAQAYQFEIQGQSEALDSNDENRDFNNYTVGGQATYYFKNVDASKGPLAEAAFLTKHLMYLLDITLLILMNLNLKT
jgi:hypothetical protein